MQQTPGAAGLDDDSLQFRDEVDAAQKQKMRASLGSREYASGG